VLALGAVILHLSGSLPHADYRELFLSCFHMALHERIAEKQPGWTS
jgi:hypothetical protein